MPRSLSRSSLPPDLRESLAALLKAKLPPGQPMTLDAVEHATTALLRELGPQLMADVLEGVESDPKKGALLCAVAPPHDIKG